MRISNLSLEWFRGSAERISLETRQKSVVIYGNNGSGKSTFVDAIEYCLEEGRVDHLCNEYSGTKQEKALINTKKPADKKAIIKLTFSNSYVQYQIADNGSAQKDDEKNLRVEEWDTHRIVLRHNNLSNFINSTKTEKYNTLLPLLGLEFLEIAAENIKGISKIIEKNFNNSSTTQKINLVEDEWRKIFGDKDDQGILDDIINLIKNYGYPDYTATNLLEAAQKLNDDLEAKLENSNNSIKEHSAFIAAYQTSNLQTVDDYKKIDFSVLGNLGSFIEDRLSILQSSSTYAQKISGLEQIECPSCGKEIPTEEYKNQVGKEIKRLELALSILNQKRKILSTLAKNLENLIKEISAPILSDWLNAPSQENIKAIIATIKNYNLEELQKEITEEQLAYLENNLKIVYNVLKKKAEDAPPQAAKLSADIHIAKIALSRIELNKLVAIKNNYVDTHNFLIAVEQEIRNHIKNLTNDRISAISSDIQKYWELLHPNKPIKEIKLYIPPENIKGIDIALEFYGKKQDSPRLTLSEGHRNSLALCIFLALANQGKEADKPIVLDDVVISFDRDHRSQIHKLLQEEFSDRQVLIFTHDREWYTELRTLLQGGNWEFKYLMPWQSPEQGITWSQTGSLIAEAKEYLNTNPEIAINRARSHMDIFMPIVAEKIYLEMPFLKGEKNDMRTASPFLDKIISKSTSYQIRQGDKYEPLGAVKPEWEDTRNLLVAWANRGSHGKPVTKEEAEEFILSCETTIQLFYCGSCKKPIWEAIKKNK
ncbi:MAG: hypothetical protein EYC62_00400, partial [Alphaproteobacteria bacterium]